MSKSSKEFGWGLRLLIMAYGFGIVLVGLDPIKKEHGSLANFISKDSIVRAAESFDPKKLLPPTAKVAKGAEGPVARPVEASERKLDQLTVEDRKQLNKLMEGL